MKKIKSFLLLFLIVGTMSSSIMAQQNLSAWMKRCESVESIEMTVITRRNPETKKEESKIVKVVFVDNKALLDELLSAFQKDKESAYQFSEKKSTGVIRPEFCRFSKNKTETRYMFEFKGNKVTVTEQFFYDYVDLGG